MLALGTDASEAQSVTQRYEGKFVFEDNQHGHGHQGPAWAGVASAAGAVNRLSHVLHIAHTTTNR